MDPPPRAERTRNVAILGHPDAGKTEVAKRILDATWDETARQHHIGFTGTREGMTAAQAEMVEVVLAGRDLAGVVVHHGDCIGADAGFHAIARAYLLDGVSVWGHPPDDDTYRAFCDFDIEYPPAPYLTRNAAIVRATSLLIAAPKEKSERTRGGTWWTVRCAWQRRRHVIIVWPDGTHLDCAPGVRTGVGRG